MSHSFTKLFTSITESTVWMEPDGVRLVWITMLAMADRAGRVWASIPGLANRARVSLSDCEYAIVKFLAPDPYSRTKEHDGRRIEEIPGGWRLLNYKKYREMQDEESTKESKRRWWREHKSKEAMGDKLEVKLEGLEKLEVTRTHSTQAEAEAEAEVLPKQRKDSPPYPPTSSGAPAPRQKRAVSLNPPTAAMVDEYLDEIGETRFTGQEFIDAYEMSGWKLKSGLPMIDWKAAVRTWRRMRDKSGEPQKTKKPAKQQHHPKTRDQLLHEECLRHEGSPFMEEFYQEAKADAGMKLDFDGWLEERLGRQE